MPIKFSPNTVQSLLCFRNRFNLATLVRVSCRKSVVDEELESVTAFCAQICVYPWTFRSTFEEILHEDLHSIFKDGDCAKNFVPENVTVFLMV